MSLPSLFYAPHCFLGRGFGDSICIVAAAKSFSSRQKRPAAARSTLQLPSVTVSEQRRRCSWQRHCNNLLVLLMLSVILRAGPGFDAFLLRTDVHA